MIFDEIDLTGLSNNELKDAAIAMKTRVESRRQYYNQVRNCIFEREKWSEYNIAYNEFEKNFYPNWNNQWGQLQTNNHLNSYEAYFERLNEASAKVEAVLDKINPTSELLLTTESLRDKLLDSVRSEVNDLKDMVKTEIESGIKDLIGLKAELRLSGNFADSIEKELSASETYKSRFMCGFIGSLILIPLFWLGIAYINSLLSLSTVDVNVLRLGVSIPLFILSYFLFNQYKLYQMMSVRYTHLKGFVGGGASFISTLVDSEDKAVKLETNKALAELFMRNDEVFGLVKKNDHPADSSIEKMTKLVAAIHKSK
ncbi:hypothetical protein [Vibrio hepatarius]|uniref:hypothetical protein n=1 Tax=Vibrio hepatarius TaxID=171383 RepID=UPI0037352468